MPLLQQVHCRVGSLERLKKGHFEQKIVHCRVGSLEMKLVLFQKILVVHCRVGSLEKLTAKNK